MPRFLALVILATAFLPVRAQDLEILSVTVHETTANAVELVVGVQNHRRTATHFSVRASLPGVAEAPMARSSERLASGATAEVSLHYDAAGLARPFTGVVSLRNHRGDEVDTHPYTLVTMRDGPPPAEERSPPPDEPTDDTPPVSVSMSTQMYVEVPAVEPGLKRIRGLRFVFETGEDDLRNNTSLLVRVTHRDGRILTTWRDGDQYGNVLLNAWAELKKSERPGVPSRAWTSEWAREASVGLNEPVTLAEIGTIALRIRQGHRSINCIGCTDDNWDLAELRVMTTFPTPPRRVGEERPEPGPEEGTKQVFYYSEGDRPARFTKDLPVLVLHPVGDYVPGRSRHLRGQWQSIESGVRGDIHDE